MTITTLSVIIPTYNASDTIEQALTSAYASNVPDQWDLEIIVVNDGSTDTDLLITKTSQFKNVILLHHDQNHGKCAAMNTGIMKSCGDFIFILDADDEFMPNWATQFISNHHCWPKDSPICFFAAQTPDGLSTASNPKYSGPLNYGDIFNERYIGEYMPVFRGDNLRQDGGYQDLKERWPCELYTYLRFVKQADCWINSTVLRLYHFNQAGSFSASIGKPEIAGAIVNCYDKVLDTFGADYKTLAPAHYQRRLLRLSVFSSFAKNGRALTFWLSGASIRAPLYTIAAIALIITGPSIALQIIRVAKSIGILRRFG